jgi:formylglycine-generating enzyme required for sulfatase activity
MALSFYGCHLKVGFEEKVALDDAMIFVEGGTFIMGSDADHDVLEYSRPAHEVTVDSFYISKYEITQKEWFAIMNSNSSEIQGDNFPVNNISWYEAVVYCNKRSLAEGLTPVYSGQGGDTRADWSANGYRLPTEAEWEYAAQGGNKSQHYTYSGSNKLDEVAWHDHWIGSGFTDMHPVGMLKANELGLYDMSGNVWEWVWDWYDYYSASAQQNPTGPMGPASGQRVIKGGSHMDGDHYDYPTQHSPFYHRGRNPSAKRSGDNSWSDPSGIGFRVVRKH